MPAFPLTLRTPMPYRPAATDRVRYVGEPVAVVVATSRHLAEDAAELVEVSYEPLPAVVDVRAALQEDAPLLHEEAQTNVATDRSLRFGEVEAAFARARYTVHGSFSFPRYSSTPIETYGVIAHWEREGTGDQVTAWCNFHGPFTMQPVIAGALGLQPGRVRLIVPEDIGGSFGIKSGVYAYVALMAIASRYAGAPVRWIEDRIEHLLASSAGTDREMEFEAAVDQDGRITALRLDLIDNVGAYLRPPEPATLYRCFGNLTGAYAINAVALRSRAVVTNKAPTGPQPRLRRPAAVLRARAADGQDRRATRSGPGRAPPAQSDRPRRIPVLHADRRSVRLRQLPGRPSTWRSPAPATTSSAAHATRAASRAACAASGSPRSSTRQAPTSATSGSPHLRRRVSPGGRSRARPSTSGWPSTPAAR